MPIFQSAKNSKTVWLNTEKMSKTGKIKEVASKPPPMGQGCALGLHALRDSWILLCKIRLLISRLKTMELRGLESNLKVKDLLSAIQKHWPWKLIKRFKQQGCKPHWKGGLNPFSQVSFLWHDVMMTIGTFSLSTGTAWDSTILTGSWIWAILQKKRRSAKRDAPRDAKENAYNTTAPTKQQTTQQERKERVAIWHDRCKQSTSSSHTSKRILLLELFVVSPTDASSSITHTRTLSCDIQDMTTTPSTMTKTAAQPNPPVTPVETNDDAHNVQDSPMQSSTPPTCDDQVVTTMQTNKSHSKKKTKTLIYFIYLYLFFNRNSVFC